MTIRTGTWEGGNPDCDNCNPTMTAAPPAPALRLRLRIGLPGTETCAASAAPAASTSIGLEDTPELWVEPLVAVFREVRRVLTTRRDAVVEVGDSYAGSGPTNLAAAVQH